MNERTTKRAKFLIDVAYIAVVVTLVYLALKYVAGWILPFIVAFCIVSVIHPLIMRVVKLLGLKQEIVSIIIMILIYATVGTLLLLLILQIIFLARDALALLPQYYTSTIKPAFTSLNADFANIMGGLPESWRLQAESMQRELINSIQGFLFDLSKRGITGLSGFTTRVPSFLIAFLFTIMLSFFLSMQYNSVVAFIKTQLPPRARKIIQATKVIMIDTIFKYIRAAMTLMCITFLELSAGLLVLGCPNAIPIAVGIAAFDALPFFGTGAIVVPWILIELVQGNFTFALGLVILYAIIIFVRGIIEPKIVGDNLGLNRIVSLVSIYLGFKVIGVLGMIIMPITTQIILELHRKGNIRLFREENNQTEPDDESNAGEKTTAEQ